MTRAIAQTYTFMEENRSKLMRFFTFACILMALAYVFNVYMVISRTISLQKIQADIETLAKNVQALDTIYLDLSSRLTPDGLTSYGLREGQVSAYISRTPSLGKVALGVNEL